MAAKEAKFEVVCDDFRCFCPFSPKKNVQQTHRKNEEITEIKTENYHHLIKL